MTPPPVRVLNLEHVAPQSCSASVPQLATYKMEVTAAPISLGCCRII